MVLAACSSYGQGLHFTQFNMSPLTLNPALTGKYEGTFRVGGIVRDQWKAVIESKEYQTGSVYIDAPLIKGFKRGDWIGAGIMAFQDVVGAGTLKNTAFKLSAAYHLSLDKKSNNILTLGVQFGSEARSVGNNWRFDNDIITKSNVGDPKLSTGDGKANFNDWTGGLLFSSNLNKNSNVKIGFSLFHLTKPTYTLTGSTGDGAELSRRAIVHGTFDTKLNKKWTLSPSFLFQTTATQDEIMIQALAGYLWDTKRDLTFHMGLSYRLADAISPMLGAQYKKLRLGFAYDIRTGQILNDATGGRGGFELAAYYIQRIYKQPKVKTKILCPRF
jgi:type IX secretion system PorP/SprF family membrane protein